MKGFRSAILNEQGQPLGEQEELAHILAMTYASLESTGQYVAGKKQDRLWGIILALVGVVLIALFRVNIALMVVGAIVLVIGGIFIARAYTKKPTARVTRVGRGYWVSGLYNFEDGKLLVDKSGLSGPVKFEVPVPSVTPDQMVEVAREAKKAIESPPCPCRPALRANAQP